MRIHSVRVRKFGTIDALDVDLDKGLNVITGPNETGKSTLMRAIWFALTRRARSQAQEIRDIEPDEGGTPEVEVTLSVDGTEYEVRKTFAGPSGETVLRVNDGGKIRSHKGDDANERLREALGFGAPSGKKKTPAHYGIWPTIWVEQGNSGIDPGLLLDEDGSPDAVSSVLAKEGGDILAGTEGEDLIEKAYQKYRTFFTDSGNETTRSGAPLYEAKQRLEEAKKRLGRLQETRDAFEDDLEDYKRYQSEIEEIDERLPDLLREAREALEEVKQVKDLRNTLETKEAKLETAEKQVQQAKAQADTREGLQEKIETLEEELSDLKDTVQSKEETLRAHKDKRSALTEERAAAETQRDEWKRRVGQLRAHLEVLQSQEKLDAVQDDLDKLDELSGDRANLTRDLASISVEEGDVDKLETLKEQRDEARTRLQAAAAQLQVTALDDLDLDISGDAISLASGDTEDRRIDEPTTVEIESLVRIELEPGGEDLASIREKARNAQDELADALSQLGLESVAEGRSQLRTRNQLETKRDGLDQQIEDLAPEGRSALETRKVELEERVKAAKKRRSEHTEPSDDNLPDEEEKTRRRLQQAEEELDQAEEHVADAARALQEHDTQTQELKNQKQIAETNAENANESLKTARKELKEHRNEHGTDEELDEKLENAKGDRDQLKEKVEDLEDDLDDLNPDDIEDEKERAEDALAQAKEERETVKEHIAELRGRLRRKDLRGLHERLEEARHEHEETKADVERLQKQADAAKLLYGTLCECRAEARKQYLAPLREEAEELLDRFFGSDEIRVEFGEKFDIQRLNRSADGSFRFDQLSAGAKEQLSVLVRLAMARLMARERPHPVFLDDALADTDPNRFKAIARILRKVSDEMQIVMMTCHRDRYRDLGVPTKNIQRLKRPTA